MNKYSATFADGTTITRTSAREYGVAWRATWTNDNGRARAETGFSSSREKANPYRPKVAMGGGSSRDREWAKRQNDEFIARSGYGVEFAPAVRA